MGGLSHFHLKVGKHEGTSPCNQSVQLVPLWVYWKGLVTGQGLVPWTVHTKHSEEQVARTCPQNSNQSEFVGLVAGTKIATRFWSKNGQFTQWDISPQLVAGSSRRDYSPRTCRPLERTHQNFWEFPIWTYYLFIVRINFCWPPLDHWEMALII